jgi:hypothetical protein
VEISRATNGKHTDPGDNSNMQPKKKAKHRKYAVKVEGPAYSSRRRDRQRMAKSMMMMIYEKTLYLVISRMALN